MYSATFFMAHGVKPYRRTFIYKKHVGSNKRFRLCE